MSEAVRQDEQAIQLREGLETLSSRARSWRGSLTEDQLAWPPPTGGWSIRQIFEHLCIANDSYISSMDRLLADAKPNAGKARLATWRPTVMGNFLVRSFRSPRRMPAPKMYRPGPSARAAVIDAFLERQDLLTNLLDRAADVVWQELRMRSPVTSLIRLNLGDGFTILVVHAERHFEQIERIEGHAAFPR
ncbi:MAG: DinB family protein [Gemmatimonadales bacterium]